LSLVDIIRVITDYALQWWQFHRRAERERRKKEIVNRFDRILSSQGLERLQVVRLVPAMRLLTAADILDDGRLLKQFTNEVLDSMAATFGVQRSWLELVDDRVYAPFNVYKNLRKFLDLLSRSKSRNANAALHVVKGCDNRLTESSGSQPIVVFLREEIARPDDANPVWRDVNIDDHWIWTYQPGRIELKAMALMAWQFDSPVYSYVTKQKHINAFLEGKSLCGELISDASIHAWHLDDYIFTLAESACSQDEQEALKVREYLEEENLMVPLLEAVGRTTLKVPLG